MRSLPQNFRTEASGDENRPLELIDIHLSDGQSYYFVSNNTENVVFYDVYGTQRTYVTAPITRDDACTSTGMDIDRIRIGIANVDKTMVGYLQAREFRGRRLVVRQIFANMLSNSGDALTVFDGLMDSPAVDQEWLSVNIVPKISSLSKKGPGRWYQLPCNWKFGSAECGIDTTGASYTKTKTTGTGSSITRISGDDIDEADRYWRRGYVRFTSGQNENARQTIKNSGSKFIELDNPLIYAPANGDTYTVVAGCDKTLLMCSGDWSNGANFGGYHTIPENMIIKA